MSSTSEAATWWPASARAANTDCQPDDLPFDADVFVNLSAIPPPPARIWGPRSAAAFPWSEAPARSRSATRARSRSPIRSSTVQFQVPAGTRSLRVALNAEEGLLVNEFDLFLHRLGPPGPGQVECSSTRDGAYEYCEVANPAAGNWNARVVGTSGTGSYQLTTTILRQVDLGPCVPGPKTLCIDDAPGDGRFEATIASIPRRPAARVVSATPSSSTRSASPREACSGSSIARTPRSCSRC